MLISELFYKVIKIINDTHTILIIQRSKSHEKFTAVDAIIILRREIDVARASDHQYISSQFTLCESHNNSQYSHYISLCI